MTTLMRYDPFREAISLRNAVDQLFEQSFVRPNWFGNVSSAGSLVAPMDVYETEQGYQVRLLLNSPCLSFVAARLITQRLRTSVLISG